jgi:hypothetical protein
MTDELAEEYAQWRLDEALASEPFDDDKDEGGDEWWT